MATTLFAYARWLESTDGSETEIPDEIVQAINARSGVGDMLSLFSANSAPEKTLALVESYDGPRQLLPKVKMLAAERLGVNHPKSSSLVRDAVRI